MTSGESSTPVAPPDRLNRIGVLNRREIEARILGPMLERFADEFGTERVHELARDVVVDVAREQGAAIADSLGNNDLETFAASMEHWMQDGALEVEILERTAETFRFNVTRCRYAEMYRSLGISELGATLSCNRDATLIEGFNGDIEFNRTQTIMSGADHCDFAYRLPAAE